MFRTRFVPVTLVATVLAAVLAAAPATAQDAVPTTQLIVAVAADDAASAVERLDDQVDVHARDIVADDITTVQVPRAAAAEAIAALEADPRVAYVEPDVVARVSLTPGDPLYGLQWGTVSTDVPQVWDATRGDAGVVVAVIDTGVAQNHPDFAGAGFTAGWDFVNGDADPSDDNGHGTAAAGVIAAQHNGTGTAGICPDCTIMPLKAMGSAGTGSHSAIAAAIDYAVSHGADIINLSLGSEGSSATLANAVSRAEAAGALVVAAAGNSGVTTVFYPAGYPQAVGVAAAAQDDSRYSWSNNGPWVELAAPGCNAAPDLEPSDGSLAYAHFCGTSSAAPFVAGVAGLLLSAEPDADGAQLRAALASSAVPVPYVSAGRVDADAAHASLGAVEPDPVAPDPVAPGPVDPQDPGADEPDAPADPVDPPDSGDPVSPGPGDAVPPRADTATDVTPSSTVVDYGATVEIAGHLSTADPEGATVTLLHRPGGGTQWFELGTQATDASGAVEFSRTPSTSARYQLRFDGDEGREGSVSDIVTIEVRPQVALEAPTAVLSGRTFTATGTFVPARDDAQIRLQRKTDTGWTTVATAAPDNGNVSFRQAAATGRQPLRLSFPGDAQHAPARSAVAVVIGDRVAVARVQADAPGIDRRNLNGEILVLRNRGTAPAQLKGWVLRSRSTDRTFALDEYRLPAGGVVRVHSGSGRTTRGHLYLGARRGVWRNGHDVAVLTHPAGGRAARVRW